MSLDSGRFTFLQVSDVHLDSALVATRLSLPPDKRQQRNAEILEALLACFAEAKRRRLDAVVIPGDLWDSRGISARTFNRLIEGIMELGEIPVVLSPGNHDYYSPDSLYCPAVLSARGMRPWPANVHVFSSPQFTAFRHPQKPEVVFTGRAFTANVPVSERLLSKEVPVSADARVNILVFHGSLDGYKGGDAGWPGKHTAPFSALELEALGFTYAAVGHYHDLTEIRGKGGRLLGAYSGCLAGRGLDEPGPRYAIVGSIEYDGEAARCDIEKLEIDRRRIVSVTCDITGATSAEVLEEVESALREGGARASSDIVFIKLEGRHPTGGEPVYVAERYRNVFYHLVIEDETRPDYLTERFDKRTTEGKFIQAMLELKKKAEAQGGLIPAPDSGEPLAVATIEDALYYGLDALKQRKVTVRHVD